MKRLHLFFLIFFLFNSFFLFSSPSSLVKEYTLENGMTVFLLEDDNDATVRVELNVKAGFSSQTQETNGFFKLYTNLVKSKAPFLQSAQCLSDSSSYICVNSPSSLYQTLDALSSTVFNLSYSEEELSAQLENLKKESTENADSLSGFINSAIDSKVFSDAPWKNDSGIYPPVFKKTTSKQARTLLELISEKWYTPQNSALFISGNINQNQTLLDVKSTFGRFYSTSSKPSQKPLVPLNKHRKYVIHNSEFSQDITQVVVQFTNFQNEEALLMSQVLNDSSSYFKQAVLSNPSLNIIGDEYINVSNAQKKDCSRLIFQTLIQAPENSKKAVSSVEQVQLFLNEISSIEKYISPSDFVKAKDKVKVNFQSSLSNPTELMENLSDFWAIQQYSDYSEADFKIFEHSPTLSAMYSTISKINEIELNKTIKTLQSEEPFVFVIISDSDYKKLKKEYTSNGFEEITTKNASWYVQSMYKEIKDQLKPEEENYFTSDTINLYKEYVSKNENQIVNRNLSNGIKVSAKKTDSLENLSFVISLSGGEMANKEDYGFEEVMINIITNMIQKDVYQKQMQGIILGNVNIDFQTGLSSSTISFELEKSDFTALCSSIISSLIYAEIPPSVADRAVSSRQYKKRLENGSAVRQLKSKAISTIFGKGRHSKVFDAENEILEKTDYNKILENYPSYLDAQRYSLFLCGDFDDSYIYDLEKYFGLLSGKTAEKASESEEKGTFPKNKAVSVSIRHTFLTDIPAEKAGPQPAVLVPTTEFLDPVIYVLEAPSKETASKNYTLFKALLNYLEDDFQETLAANKKVNKSKVSVNLPEKNVDYAFIVVQDVPQTKEIDSSYKTEILKIQAELQAANANNNIVQKIKDKWITKQMVQTNSSLGTALLMQKSSELFSDNKKSSYYLEEYKIVEEATNQDFLNILNYFPVRPELRLYSKDANV